MFDFEEFSIAGSTDSEAVVSVATTPQNPSTPLVSPAIKPNGMFACACTLDAVGRFVIAFCVRISQ